MSNDFNYKLEELHNLPCRISELRISKGLSKKQLATALGVSASTISSYECGTRLPSLDMLVKLCYYFKVSSDYILGIEKPKNYSTCNTDGLTLNQMKAIEAITAPLICGAYYNTQLEDLLTMALDALILFHRHFHRYGCQAVRSIDALRSSKHSDHLLGLFR